MPPGRPFAVRVLARERLALCAVVMVVALLFGAVWEVLRLQRGNPKEKGRDSIGN